MNDLPSPLVMRAGLNAAAEAIALLRSALQLAMREWLKAQGEEVKTTRNWELCRKALGHPPGEKEPKPQIVTPDDVFGPPVIPFRPRPGG